MAWSIVEVARMAPVTSRTLRHYDAIGLLRPAYVGSNGRRFYAREQLLRLQQILLLRELGVDLGTIGRVLDGHLNQVEALREHEHALRLEQERLGHLAVTVTRTIAQLEGRGTMTAAELFEGLKERTTALESELVGRHGEGVREHFADARERTADWTEADYLRSKAEGEELDGRFLALLRSGVGPSAPEALELTGEHYTAVSAFWTPDATSYTGLGRLYVDSPQFRARYDAQDPGLAEYLREALAAYARERL